jgi:hypothetical protein
MRAGSKEPALFNCPKANLRSYSKTVFRGIAALLAGLGLLPFFWAGLVSGDWNVARVTLIDPIAVAVVSMTVAMVATTRVRQAISWTSAFMRRAPAPLLLVAAGLFIVTAGVLVARLAYGGQPVLTDEFSQAFQGRILMSGRLAAIPEPHPEFFETSQTVNRPGHWFSQYPIGSGMLAALGGWTDLGILINPLLLAMAGLAIWAFARRAYDDATARIALILVAASPFAVFMSATRMNHVPTLTLTALALAALAGWSEASSRRTATFLAAGVGAAIGGMVLIRPYDAVLVAMPIAIFQLCVIARRRDLASSLVAQIITGAALSAVQLWVNAKTTGSATLFGYDALNGIAHRPGFHLDPLGVAFTPSRGLDYVMLYLQRLNTSLFESAVPALAFIVGAMWLSRPTRWDWLLAGLMLSLLGGYGAYWHQGQFSGPRFLYPAIIAFVVFTSRFVVLLARSNKPAALGASLIVPVCVVLAFVPSSIGDRSTGVWLRVSAMRDLPVSQSEDPTAEAKAAGLHNALVFVREPLHARIAARLRALGMAPFDAEQAVTNLDACALLDALARSDARPDVPAANRLNVVLREAQSAGPTQPIAVRSTNDALSLVNGRPASAACLKEITEDRGGTVFFARFLAAATLDEDGRLGGDVVYARWLGARDSILLRDRFASREWYVYRREDSARSGRFERIR